MMKSIDINLETILKNFFLAMTVISFLFSMYFTFTNLSLARTINAVLAMPFVFFLTPYLFMGLFKLKKVESKMQIIPRFLRDVVDNVESGMDLISSIKATTGSEYTVLNEDIKKLANQLSWGIDFDEAFLNFARNVGSKDLYRDFRLIVEARTIGGHVEAILRELSFKINIENLRKKERSSNLSSNTFTGYISFLIFIFIIILIYNNLFLGLGSSLSGGDVEGALVSQANLEKTSIYLTFLLLMSYELAILSGFLFGLMQDNNIINGAPHVVILVLMTFVGFFFFIKY